MHAAHCPLARALELAAYALAARKFKVAIIDRFPWIENYVTFSIRVQVF